MSRIFDSQLLRRIFVILLKTNNVNDFLHKTQSYMVRTINSVNREYFPITIGGKYKHFPQTFSIDSGNVISDINEGACLKIFIIFFKYVEPLLQNLTIYPIQNLLKDFDLANEEMNWSKFVDKSIDEYCSENPSAGCKYSLPQIKEHYPHANASEIYLLYKLCNTMGLFVNLTDINKLDTKAFEIKPSRTVVIYDKQYDVSDLFMSTLPFVENYINALTDPIASLTIKESEILGKSYFEKFSGKTNELKNNPLIHAILFKIITSTPPSTDADKRNINIFKEFHRAYGTIIRKIFLANIFKRDIDIIRSVPNLDAVSLISNSDIVVDSINRFKEKQFKFSTNTNSLPFDIDEKLTQIMFKFFEERFKIKFDKYFLTLMLLYTFAVRSTNIKIIDDYEKINFSYDNISYFFTIKDLYDYCSDNLDFSTLKNKNVFRLWCNNRSMIALFFFKELNLPLYLFSRYPNILPYMRFDYYKGLDISQLNTVEQKSLFVIRRVVENRVSNTQHNQKNLDKWVSNRENF